MEIVFDREGNPKSLASTGTVTRYVRLGLFGLLAIVVAGCGKGMDDLQQYVEEIKSRDPKGIEALPEIKPYQKYGYVADDLRDPFDSSAIANNVVLAERKSESKISPDPNRPSEFLETFPLDTLRMVGTLEQGASLWALVRTPDATVQRVSVGNHMGKNYGKIHQITGVGMDLTEIIPDGFGGWRKRATHVALSE